jgi:subtilisin family serine protease
MQNASTSSRRTPRALAPLVLFALVVVALAGAQASQAAPDPVALDTAEAVAGELIVGFDPEASRSQERGAVTGAGATIEERVDLIDGAVVTADGERDLHQVADELRDAGAVRFVEPNYVVRAARLPNDSAFNRLWGLRNDGQLGGKPGADVSAPGAWDLVTGGPVTVAVVDTGVEGNHPDLAENMWTNPTESQNGLDDGDPNGLVDDMRGADFLNGDTDPSDESGHGTHVAGIIGARGDNGTGIVGVNWSVRLMALKFMNEHGEGSTGDAAQAIDYAVDAGAKVINASWGGPTFSQALYEAVARAADHDVLFVAAAGNEGENADHSPEYPAAFELPNVISVAASDVRDSLLDFSNYGAQSVDLAAPGDEIYSTVPTSIDGDGYATFSGTSMAAPFVSGAAALYFARSPASSASEVREALIRGVDRSPSLAGKSTSGGRLNIAKALGTARPAPEPAPARRDQRAPSRFRLLRPRDRHASRRRSLLFRWQASTDPGGIFCYKLYVDGRKRKTLRDPDGPGGRDPATSARLRLSAGKHEWYVRAYDYAGNRRTIRSARHDRSVLFIGRRAARDASRRGRSAR